MFDKFTVILLMGFMALPASAEPFVKESAFWAVEVENGDLDPAPLRIPQTPLIVDLEDKGKDTVVELKLVFILGVYSNANNRLSKYFIL